MDLPDYAIADPRYYTLPRAELRALADERLRTQLRYVYATTPFWRRKLDAAGVDPARFRGLDDLDRLPFCTKQELQENQAAHPPFGSYVASDRRRWVRYMATSGTTGRPLRRVFSARDWRCILDRFRRQPGGLAPGDVSVALGPVDGLMGPMVALDLAAAQGAAIRQRPDLLKARLQAIHQDYAVRLGRAAYIPDVSFVIRYISPVTADQLPKNIAYAGVEISWDIWDWGKKAASLEQSKRAREQAKNAAEDAASQVVLDVNSAFRKLEDAQAFVGVAEQNREYAREALRETTNQFRQQTALPKDVLAAQATLGQASDQYRQAVLSYWEARASFDKALGVDQ
jgi:hypothetical protein